jgi:hypothetical protein
MRHVRGGRQCIKPFHSSKTAQVMPPHALVLYELG